MLSLIDLDRKIAQWRLKSDKIVFTNGCFDLLHAGHVELLKEANNLGHRLIVGLNSDESINKLKGDNRPINSQKNRAFVLSALCAVDAVIIFEEDTPKKLIEHIKPDVLVKGGDYKEREIVGANFVKNNGGMIVILPLREGLSSTNLIKKIKEKG